MKSSPDGLQIFISSSLKGNTLILEIKNTGKWEANGLTSGRGIKNIKERLRNAYPGNHLFDVYEREGMIHVTIKISLP